MLLVSKVLIVLSILAVIHAAQFEVTDQIYFDIQIGNQHEGRIVIGLFGKIVPRTVKNFITIATEGIAGKTYNQTLFHRTIKRFMIQGGDVLNNDGTGSVSVYGKYFDDENFQVNHTSGGYVSMVNSGPNTNGCQFFITTMPTPWLDSHHTVFGKVTKGQKIVHKIERIPTDARDRPLIPIKIIDSGSLALEGTYFISDQTGYTLWTWIRDGFVPLSFSFAILSFFCWVIKKLDNYKLKYD